MITHGKFQLTKKLLFSFFFSSWTKRSQSKSIQRLHVTRGLCLAVECVVFSTRPRFFKPFSREKREKTFTRICSRRTVYHVIDKLHGLVTSPRSIFPKNKEFSQLMQYSTSTEFSLDVYILGNWRWTLAYSSATYRIFIVCSIKVTHTEEYKKKYLSNKIIRKRLLCRSIQFVILNRIEQWVLKRMNKFGHSRRTSGINWFWLWRT